MVIRLVAAVLWFAAISWASNFASALVGFPPVLGLAVAAAAGAFIAVDPLKFLWPVRIESVAHSPALPADPGQVVKAGR